MPDSFVPQAVQDFLDSLAVELSPMGDRVAILPDPEEKESSTGIIIPDTVEPEKRKQTGMVVALGRGNLGPDCVTPKDHYRLGDRVIFGQYSGDNVTLSTKSGGSVTVKILRADAILACCNPL